MNKIALILFNLLFLIALVSSGQRYLKQGDSIKAVADSFFIHGNYDQALKFYQEETLLYSKNHDLNRTIIGNSNISFINYYKGDFDNAIKICKNGLQNLPFKSETDTIRFRLETFLGLYYSKKNLDSSNKYYKLAEGLIQSSNSVSKCSDIINFYSDLGVRNFKNYDLIKANLYYQKAINSLFLDKLYNKSILFYNQGTVYLLRKEYEKALRNFNQAEQSVLEKRTLYYILKEKANCLQKMGRLTEAEANFQLSWKIYKAFVSEKKLPADLYFETAYYNNLGSLESRKGNFSQAFIAFQKAVQLEKMQNKQSITLTDTYRQLAEASIKQKQALKALKYYQQAIQATHFKFTSQDIYQNPTLNKVLSERELFKALAGRAAAFRLYYQETHNPKDLEASIYNYQLSIQLAEKIRKNYSSAEAKGFFTETNYDIYQEAMEVTSLRQTPQNQQFIFDLQEKSRAAILTDISREVAIKPKTISTALLNQERNINQEITRLQLDIKKQRDSLTLIDLNKKLVDAQIFSNRLIDRFEREFPNYYQLKYAQKTLPIQEIQQNLDNKTCLLSYTLTDKELFIVTISSSKSKFYQLKLNPNFQKDLLDFNKQLYNAPQGLKYQADNLSSKLYQQLIEPLQMELIVKNRLIIIRNGVLNYLPFEVLAKQKGEYLLKKFAISYANSATSLFSSKTTDSQNKMLGIAPFANISSLKNISRNQSLQALPATEEEIKKIGGDILLNEDATKKHFMEEYRNAGIIHFATHAVTNDNEPNESFIAFHPDNQGFKLMTDELYNLDLSKSQLVVLSACETGSGKLQKGEGIISLARGFAYAGCPSVITTLWNAHDEATAFLSRKLYEYLKKGYSKDEALRATKIDFLDSDIGSRYQHPHYWANFILIGDSEIVKFQANWTVWIVSLVLLIVIIGYFYLSKKQL